MSRKAERRARLKAGGFHRTPSGKKQELDHYQKEFDATKGLPLEVAPTVKTIIDIFQKRFLKKENKLPVYQDLKTPEQLAERFQSYLIWSNQFSKPLTIERCAFFLGIDTHTLKNYENIPELSVMIKAIREFITADKVERLHSQQSVAGIIFDLKNHEGWRDKTSLEISGEMTFVGKLREAMDRSQTIEAEVSEGELVNEEVGEEEGSEEPATESEPVTA